MIAMLLVGCSDVAEIAALFMLMLGSICKSSTLIELQKTRVTIHKAADAVLT
jgi:hypothetical protein